MKFTFKTEKKVAKETCLYINLLCQETKTAFYNNSKKLKDPAAGADYIEPSL